MSETKTTNEETPNGIPRPEQSNRNTQTKHIPQLTSAAPHQGSISHTATWTKKISPEKLGEIAIPLTRTMSRMRLNERYKAHTVEKEIGSTLKENFSSVAWAGSMVVRLGCGVCSFAWRHCLRITIGSEVRRRERSVVVVTCLDSTASVLRGCRARREERLA